MAHQLLYFSNSHIIYELINAYLSDSKDNTLANLPKNLHFAAQCNQNPFCHATHED